MSMPSRARSSVLSAQGQRGMAMVIALVFLLLLTILALSSSSHSLLQGRMVGGLRNAQQASMAAETALRGAEWKLWMSTSNLTAPLNCGSGVLAGNCYRYDPAAGIYQANGLVTTFRNSAGWVTNGAAVYMGPGDSLDYTRLSTNARLARNPLYIIEDLGVELPPGITGGLHESGATGTGGTGYTSGTRHIYRITARATGGNENTVRVLESTFAAKSN